MSRGKILGDRYKVGEKIGSGGFSTVYFCVDLQTAVDGYLEDRRKEYEEYRLGFEMLKMQEGDRLGASGKKHHHHGKRGSKGASASGGSSLASMGDPVSFEELCGSLPTPEEVIHPDVLQALLTTGKVPMLTGGVVSASAAPRRGKGVVGGVPTSPTKDRESLLSPSLYRSNNSPSSSSLASSRGTVAPTITLFNSTCSDSSTLINWCRTVVPPVYAVKVLNKSQLKNLSMEDAFEREVEAMKTITRSQPSNVINVLDVLQSTRNYYLVMDLADQGSLLSVIVRNNATLTGGGGGGLPGPAARKYFRQLINGLSFVHGADVVHRDIKPENLLLDRWRDVRISDFGFAAYSPPGRVLTRPCGTPQYAAPEVLVDCPRYDGRKVDMWSTGITLFVIAFGCLPFYGNTLDKLYNKITRGVYEIPTTLRKPPPPSLIHLVSVLLDVNPKSRWSVEMVRVHPWVLGRDDIPERLQHSYLLTVKRKYQLERRAAERKAGGGHRLTSPIMADNPLASESTSSATFHRNHRSLPTATNSFLALTSAAGLDPNKVKDHLCERPLMGRSLESDEVSSTDQHEKDMEALMMDLEVDLDDEDFVEGTDGYLFVQQHRRNMATVTQASSSCPSLRQIQGGFVLDAGRSGKAGSNQTNRISVTPNADGIASNNNSIFFSAEQQQGGSSPQLDPAAVGGYSSDSGAFGATPLPTLENMSASLNINKNTPPGNNNHSNSISECADIVSRGSSHLLDMLDGSLGDGSIAVDVQTGRLVLVEGLGKRRREQLLSAASRMLVQYPDVELARYATVLQPLLKCYDEAHEDEQRSHNQRQVLALQQQAGPSSWGGVQFGVSQASASASNPKHPLWLPPTSSPLMQDLTVHKRLTSKGLTSGTMATPPISSHSRSESLVNVKMKREGSLSSTPSSRPQSTPLSRAARGGGGDRATPEDMRNREKRAAFRRLGLVHIQIILNFIAVFAIIFVAGTAKVLFDVDVAKWPMPAFVRRFIDRILSPPKQATNSSSGSGPNSGSNTGFSTARSTPGGAHPTSSHQNSPGMESKSSSNWSPSLGSGVHSTHQLRQHNSGASSSFDRSSVIGASMNSSSHNRHTRSQSKTLSDTTPSPPPPLATSTLPNSLNQAPQTLARPPSTFTLSSTPLTTTSSIPAGCSPSVLPHTNSPSTGVQFPVSELPLALGGSFGTGSTIRRPKPTKVCSTLSSSSSSRDDPLPRTLTAQGDQPQADPVPVGTDRLLHPMRSIFLPEDSPLVTTVPSNSNPIASKSPHLHSCTVENSSFHSGNYHRPAADVTASCEIRGEEGPTPPYQVLDATPAIRGGGRGHGGGGVPVMVQSGGGTAPPLSPTSKTLLKRVRLSASAYRRSGELEDDHLHDEHIRLADEDATHQQGFKPSQQAKQGLQRMKRIDSHAHAVGGLADLADLDDGDSLAT